MRTPGTSLAALALVAVTAIWGSTFFILKDALDHVSPADFLAVRFCLAALILLPATWGRLKRLTRGQWLRGVGLGAIYGVAQILQTVGLTTTDASVSGFVTGMYVVITPVLLVLICRTRIQPTTALASLLALAGLGVLSLSGASVSTGALITFGGSVVYALHIVALGVLARDADPLTLTTTQMIGIALVCLAAGAPDGIAVPGTTAVWGPLLYMVLASGIVTMGLQTWAQARLSATRTAVIMTLEPVFAALFAILVGQDQLSLRLLVGGGLVLAAMLLGESRQADAPAARQPAGPAPPAGVGPNTNDTTDRQPRH